MTADAGTAIQRPDSKVLLDVDDLRVGFRAPGGSSLPAVSGVSFALKSGSVMAIVGESGSGKSVTARAIMGLLPSPPRAIVTARSLKLDGENLLDMPEKHRRRLRGNRISMIFQDVLGSLHPQYSIGWQIVETFRVHRAGLSKTEAWGRAEQLLDDVRIPNASERIHDYPHQFSGGMRQRAMIAMAMAMDPEVLIADEPTTALDVTVQAQVMDLLVQLREERSMSLILITHDLGLVTDYADHVAVMYGGRFVEKGDVADVYNAPAHPYTLGLLRSRPSGVGPSGQLEPVPGSPPQLDDMPSGCTFHPRCPLGDARCVSERPELRVVLGSRQAACHYPEKVMRDVDS